MTRYPITNRHTPPADKAIERRYPFSQMEVGDSFLVPRKDVRNIVQLRQTCLYYSRRHKGYRFSVRTEPDGFRVYRIESTQKKAQPNGK